MEWMGTLKKETNTREIDQQLRAVVTTAKDLGSRSSIDIVVSNSQ